jgi:hypothetical protein
MKFLFSFLCLIYLSQTCLSQVRVRGYFRKNGTYVSPHIRTSPDGILSNNYSYKSGNSSLSIGSNKTYQSKNYLLNNSATVISSVNNDVSKIDNSHPSPSKTNNSNKQLKDSSKFDNELYFQKLKKIYDKKSVHNN